MIDFLASFVFLALLGTAVIFARLGERIRIPSAVTLVACGTALGTIAHVRPPFAFGPTLLFVLLPPLVFEAAWNIDIAAMRAGAVRIVLLAFPGTLLTAMTVAFALVATHAAPFAIALIFGAIVSATDPVAVVAIFRRTAVPVHVRTIAEAESLANDGVAVVLYGIAVALAGGAAFSLGGALATAAAAIVAGIGLGALSAMPVIALRTRVRFAPLSIAMTVALAYASYQVSLLAHVSGIFATATAALAVRLAEPVVPLVTQTQGPASVRAARIDLDAFWESFAYIANATAFFAAGLLIDVPRAFHEIAFAVVGIVALLATRAVLAYVAATDLASRAAIFLAGMRGGLPLALALALPESLPGRAIVVDGVFATVLATLVLQGILLEPILRRISGEGSASLA